MSETPAQPETDSYDPWSIKPVKKAKKAKAALAPVEAEVTDNSHTVAAGQLRAFVERIERLTDERKDLADDLKDVYAEAKGTGFDSKALKTIVKLRAMDPDQRSEWESLVDLYKSALGMA